MRNFVGAASSAALLSLSLLAGCAADTSEEESASTSSEIVNGWDDYRHPAVVMLAAKQQNGSYNGFCTGTLVRPNKVLTAAHCVVGGASAANTVVMFGRDKDAPGAADNLVQAAKIVAHPGYKEGNTFPNDVAMITLIGNVTNIQPMPMFGGQVTQPAIVQHVGFGNSYSNTPQDATGFGKKRTVISPLRQVIDTKLVTGQALCYGDSGGPALARIKGVEYVVGVHSFITSSCNDPNNLGASQRLDVVADFISANLTN